MGFVKAIMYGLNEISKSENTVPIAKAVGISSMAIMLMIEKTMKIVAKND